MVDLGDPPSLTKQEINTKPKKGRLVNVSIRHCRHLYNNQFIIMRHATLTYPRLFENYL
jgi:hypothetical protein